MCDFVRWSEVDVIALFVQDRVALPRSFLDKLLGILWRVKHSGTAAGC